MLSSATYFLIKCMHIAQLIRSPRRLKRNKFTNGKPNAAVFHFYMRYSFLLTLFLLGSFFSVHAQRTVLYETFSNENCQPCATANPTLDALVSGNASKVLLLRYEINTPSPGRLSTQNNMTATARKNYYNLASPLPNGVADGQTAANDATSSFTQQTLNTAFAKPSPFTITTSHNWNADGDSLLAQVSVTANTAFAPAGAQLILRAALVEDVTFQSKPGNNGERAFNSIMRAMYPDANGTALPNAWTANMTQTFSIAGLAPAYVNKAGNTYLIVWIQNDNDQKIAQAARSAVHLIANDAALDDAIAANPLQCANGSAAVVANATLRNSGTSPLISATFYYRFNNGPQYTYPWVGRISPGGTANISLPTPALGAGSHVLYDSVALPNGMLDANPGNNATTFVLPIHNNVLVGLPMSTGFENNVLPTNWLYYNPNSNDENWEIFAGNNSHSGQRAMVHRNYNFAPGETNYLLMPKPLLLLAPRALDFWLAYAQYTNEEDRLEVVYSTDCGANWNVQWARSGRDLATTTAIGTSTPYLPSIADWKRVSVDMDAVPSGAIIAFRAISDFGNNLYLDDVDLRTGSSNGIKSLETEISLSIYPNPSREKANVQFNLSRLSVVIITLTDVTGRILSEENWNAHAGKNNFELNLSSLTPGSYFITLMADGIKTSRKIKVLP